MCLYLSNPLSPLLEPGRVEETLMGHFQPLLDPDLDGIFSAYYGEGVTFQVNGHPLLRSAPPPGRVAVAIRVGRQRKPSGVGYLLQDPNLIGEETGIAVSTLGKVIKRGWDWLGLIPPPDTAVGGLVEVPALAEVLTLNKADFIRSGSRGATFLAYRKAIQEVVSRHLAQWGSEARSKPSRTRRTRPLERDLQSVLQNLSKEFPSLAALVERSVGGQSRLQLGGLQASASLTASTPESGRSEEPAALADPPEIGTSRPEGDGPDGMDSGEEEQPEPDSSTLTASVDRISLPGRKPTRRPGRFGIRIQFEERSGDPELGRLVESTVWVNAAHPAYLRAVSSRSEGYHLALTVAMTLASLAVEPEQTHRFVNSFLARWGEASKP